LAVASVDRQAGCRLLRSRIAIAVWCHALPFFLRIGDVTPELSVDNWGNDRIATDESLNDNMEGMLIVMGQLLLEYEDVSNERFRGHVHRLYDCVINQSIQPLGRGDSGETRAHETSSIRLNDREQTEDAVVRPVSPSQTIDLEEELTTLPNLSETIPREDDADSALRTIDKSHYSVSLVDPCRFHLSIFVTLLPASQ
jgi:hypothetical protein